MRSSSLATAPIRQSRHLSGCQLIIMILMISQLDSALKPAGSWASAGVPTRPVPGAGHSLTVVACRSPWRDPLPYPLTHRAQTETKCLGPPLRPLRQQPQEGPTPTVSCLFPCAAQELKILIASCFSLATFARAFASRSGEGDQLGKKRGKKTT